MGTGSSDEESGPVFVREPPSKMDFSNSTGAEIPCQARGNPQPEIIWLRADGTAIGDVPGLRQVKTIEISAPFPISLGHLSLRPRRDSHELNFLFLSPPLPLLVIWSIQSH